MTQTAQAQALEPVVDVCTGIQLDQSALRNILEDTVVPTAAGLEALYGDLLTVTLGLDPLLDIDDLSLGITQTSQSLADGDPISLQVLTTDDAAVGPGECNLTADGYALNSDGGIEIGGGQISGLGAGDVATAGDNNAIAFGNGASTDPAAAGSVAIGTDASVTAGNSVALGMDSVADRGALTGYSAPGLAGTYDSIGTVSVGDDGMLRQITNVAPGTQATDAATVGQVQGALDAIAAVDATLDDAVMYDDAGHGTVTLDPGGTLVTNVANGAVDATSSDAVNGSQLYATNQLIQANSDAIDAIETTGDPLGVTYDDATRTAITLDGAGGTTIANVAEGEVSETSDEAVNGSQLYATNMMIDANTGDIDDLGDRVTVNEGDITTINERLDNVPIEYVSDADPAVPNAVPTNTAALIGATAAPVTVTNVEQATLAADSTDAVNGAQLYATNQQVAANRTDIDQNTTDIENIENNLSGSTVVAVQYSDPDAPTRSNGGTITNDVTFVGAEDDMPIRVHNVANGTSATDAVNVGQLQSAMSSAVSQANTYTDNAFDTLSTRIDDVSFDLAEARDEAFAGTAGALAVAGIPQTMEPGKSMFGGAIGYYRGQTAFALGVSSTFSDGQGVVKAGGTIDTHGKGGFSAGAGFSF